MKPLAIVLIPISIVTSFTMVLLVGGSALGVWRGGLDIVFIWAAYHVGIFGKAAMAKHVQHTDGGPYRDATAGLQTEVAELKRANERLEKEQRGGHLFSRMEIILLGVLGGAVLLVLTMTLAQRVHDHFAELPRTAAEVPSASDAGVDVTESYFVPATNFVDDPAGDLAIGTTTTTGSISFNGSAIGATDAESFVFAAGPGTPALSFDSNGDVFVRGKKVDNDRKIYREFKRWLRTANGARP